MANALVVVVQALADSLVKCQFVVDNSILPRCPPWPVEWVEVRVCNFRGQIVKGVAIFAIVMWIACPGGCPPCHEVIEAVPRRGPRREELRPAASS